MIQRNDDDYFTNIYPERDSAYASARADETLAAEDTASDAEDGADVFWRDALDRIN